jgi:hypothetical protein
MWNHICQISNPGFFITISTKETREQKAAHKKNSEKGNDVCKEEDQGCHEKIYSNVDCTSSISVNNSRRVAKMS